MKFEIVLAILFLSMNNFTAACSIQMENCTCDIYSFTIEMTCQNEDLNSKTLNLGGIEMLENVTTNLIVKIENKIYHGINS